MRSDTCFPPVATTLFFSTTSAQPSSSAGSGPPSISWSFSIFGFSLQASDAFREWHFNEFRVKSAGGVPAPAWKRSSAGESVREEAIGNININTDDWVLHVKFAAAGLLARGHLPTGKQGLSCLLWFTNQTTNQPVETHAALQHSHGIEGGAEKEDTKGICSLGCYRSGHLSRGRFSELRATKPPYVVLHPFVSLIGVIPARWGRGKVRDSPAE